MSFVGYDYQKERASLFAEHSIAEEDESPEED